MKGPVPIPLADRLWTKVNKTETCWLWTASVNNMGYGMIGRGGRGTGKVLAHRAAYELLVGPIPDGLVLDHLCRVTRCVNPDHLEPVTQRVNLQRGANSYALRDECKNGHDITVPENVYTTPAGKHQCRLCARDADRRRYLANPARGGVAARTAGAAGLVVPAG